jgi:hypothetical protein
MNITQSLLELVSRQGDPLTVKEIKSIRKTKGGNYELKVSWDGFEDIEDSFEPFKDFLNQFPVLVLDFLTLRYSQDELLIRKVVKKYRKEINTRKLHKEQYPFLG